MDETRMTARLPRLDIEMVRRTLPGENAEAVTLHIKATPSFEAAAGMLAAFNPWAAPLLGLRLWAEMTRAAMAPWLPATNQARLSAPDAGEPQRHRGTEKD